MAGRPGQGLFSRPQSGGYQDLRDAADGTPRHRPVNWGLRHAVVVALFLGSAVFAVILASDVFLLRQPGSLRTERQPVRFRLPLPFKSWSMHSDSALPEFEDSAIGMMNTPLEEFPPVDVPAEYISEPVEPAQPAQEPAEPLTLQPADATLSDSQLIEPGVATIDDGTIPDILEQPLPARLPAPEDGPSLQAGEGLAALYEEKPSEPLISGEAQAALAQEAAPAHLEDAALAGNGAAAAEAEVVPAFPDAASQVASWVEDAVVEEPDLAAERGRADAAEAFGAEVMAEEAVVPDTDIVSAAEAWQPGEGQAGDIVDAASFASQHVP